MNDAAILGALVPLIVLLLLAVVTAIVSRALRLSPVVGYIALGLGLKLAGFGLFFGESTIGILAQLGVMLLLFEIGLHFSLARVRRQASDIFAFGPVQILFAAAVLGAAGMLFGMPPLPSMLLGAIFALSSTAVVGRLIAERHQQGCPVGLTATSILVFQDLFAILLLIVANSLGTGDSLAMATAVAVGKTLVAFSLTVAVARFVVGPLLGLAARTGNDDIFTALALLIALAAGWGAAKAGLSFTLGAFLGGVALADTPYRPVIEYEIKPFRGLLLGFFFVSIGLSVNVSALAHGGLAVILFTGLLFLLKALSNVAASRVFRWSVPGSTQLGFLLAQASEFAFVILSLGSVRAIIGESSVSIAIAVVALSMALTPTLAEAGRRLAGRMRARADEKAMKHELTPRAHNAPVIIIGMGTVGRLVADALSAFDIEYCGIERDVARLRLAVADGYIVDYGDGSDLRLWAAMGLDTRKVSVLTAPDFEALTDTQHHASSKYPQLKRIALATSAQRAHELETVGVVPVVDEKDPIGFALLTSVLTELGVSRANIDEWIERRLHGDEAMFRSFATIA